MRGKVFEEQKNKMTSEGDDKAIRILTFSGKEEDWRMWSAKFRAKASMRGYLEILDGKIVAPDDSQLEASTVTEAMKKTAMLNCKAYNELVLSCVDETCFAIIDEAKTSDHKYGDAKLAWDSLCLKFEPDTGTELVRLKKEYSSMMMKSASQDPDEYITKLENYRNKMKREPFKHEISDEDFFIHVINTLPKEYESIVETLERKLGKGKLTLKTLKTELRSKYQRIKKEMPKTEEDIGLLTKGYKKKFKGACRICGKQGHKAADCWENEKNKKDKVKAGDQKRFPGKCFYCGKVGHRQTDCFKKKKDKEASNGSAGGANVATEDDEPVLIAEVIEMSEVEEDHFNERVKKALKLDFDVAYVS